MTLPLHILNGDCLAQQLQGVGLERRRDLAQGTAKTGSRRDGDLTRLSGQRQEGGDDQGQQAGKQDEHVREA